MMLTGPLLADMQILTLALQSWLKKELVSPG